LKCLGKRGTSWEGAIREGAARRGSGEPGENGRDGFQADQGSRQQVGVTDGLWSRGHTVQVPRLALFSDYSSARTAGNRPNSTSPHPSGSATLSAPNSLTRPPNHLALLKHRVDERHAFAAFQGPVLLLRQAGRECMLPGQRQHPVAAWPTCFRGRQGTSHYLGAEGRESMAPPRHSQSCTIGNITPSSFR